MSRSPSCPSSSGPAAPRYRPSTPARIAPTISGNTKTAPAPSWRAAGVNAGHRRPDSAVAQVRGQHRRGRGQHVMAWPLAQHQLKFGQLLADRAGHAHHEIRVAAARGRQPRPAQRSRADRDRADVGDRRPAALCGGMRGHLSPHGHRPAVRHRRIRPRMEPARNAAARPRSPGTSTRWRCPPRACSTHRKPRPRVPPPAPGQALTPRATRAVIAAWACAAPVTSGPPRRAATTYPPRTLVFSSAPGMTAALCLASRGGVWTQRLISRIRTPTLRLYAADTGDGQGPTPLSDRSTPVPNPLP